MTKLTPSSEPEDQHRDRQGDDQHEVGDHQPEQQGRAGSSASSAAVEVAVLDVGDQRRGPRHAGDGEDDGDGDLERLEALARVGGLERRRQRPDVHDEEEQRHDECRDHRPRGRARISLRARRGDRGEVADEPAGAGAHGGCGAARPRRPRRWWRSCVVSFGGVALDVGAGELEEHVVERGRAQGEVDAPSPRSR